MRNWSVSANQEIVTEFNRKTVPARVCVCIYIYIYLTYPNVSISEAKNCCQLICKTLSVTWEGKSEVMSRKSNSLQRVDDL